MDNVPSEDPETPESSSSVEELTENDKGFVETEVDVEDITVAESVDVVLSTGMLLVIHGNEPNSRLVADIS